MPVEHISRAILMLRGQRVILDQDLAAIYGVPTKRLNEQVKRRFKVANCDLEERPRPKHQVPPLCLHRAWGDPGR
ncbi:MAG: ORF6N domain-containing protein [Gammaproteobacteria bacterium]